MIFTSIPLWEIPKTSMVGICGLLNCNSEESQGFTIYSADFCGIYIYIIYRYIKGAQPVVLHFGNARWKCIKHRSALSLIGWEWPCVFLRLWAARMTDVGPMYLQIMGFGLVVWRAGII